MGQQAGRLHAAVLPPPPPRYGNARSVSMRLTASDSLHHQIHVRLFEYDASLLRATSAGGPSGVMRETAWAMQVLALPA